jgi:hypothetical protein
MSDSRTAGGLDRLPWLTDEPQRKAAPAKPRSRNLLGWAAAAVLLVAGGSFWLGTRSQTSEGPLPIGSRPSATVKVPQPGPVQPQVRIAPQPQVAPAPSPEVREEAAPQVHVAPPPVRKVVIREIVRQVVTVPAKEEKAASRAPKETAAVATSAHPQPSAPAQLTPWPPRVVAGASGRLVEIGAFGSVAQAKQGWRHMVRAFPAVAHLPAVVRPDRNSRGRIFYRFRIGTTSQAHSEVLCQRMQKIDFSCAVVGLPWKAKVER